MSVLDLSAEAIAIARSRLGVRADTVHWLVDDVNRAVFSPHRYDVWHDRAVFHFLTDAADRHAYVEQVMRAVRPGGYVIVATFAEDGPEKCSGLPVMRYQPDSLHAEFGEPFQLVAHENGGSPHSCWRDPAIRLLLLPQTRCITARHNGFRRYVVENRGSPKFRIKLTFQTCNLMSEMAETRKVAGRPSRINGCAH